MYERLYGESIFHGDGMIEGYTAWCDVQIGLSDVSRDGQHT